MTNIVLLSTILSTNVVPVKDYSIELPTYPAQYRTVGYQTNVLRLTQIGYMAGTNKVIIIETQEPQEKK